MSGNSRHSCRLSRCRRLCVSCQRLHLLVTLTQVEDFDARRWVNFVNGIAGRAACFAVQVIALNEHRMVAEASQPNVAFTAKIQLNTFAYVETVGMMKIRFFCNLNLI